MPATAKRPYKPGPPPDYFNDTFFVYVLIDPRTNAVRYVGCTCNTRLRKNAHRCNRTSKVGEWVQELRAIGLRPIFKVIDSRIGVHAGKHRERKWIERLQERGFDLLNVGNN